MLNFAFPYAKQDVQAQFAVMCARLDEALRQPPGASNATVVRAYLDAKQQLRNLITPDDYKYLSFQLWQEGIARYTEYRVAGLASAAYVPSPSFVALSDYTPFETEAQALLGRIHAQLTTVKLGEARRSAFYPVGAAEGLLLDRVNPGWRSQYAGAGFSLDTMFGRR